MHFYKFKSSNESDGITNLVIFTTSIIRATIIASRYFAKHGCIGRPVRLAI